jgi:putative aldouronate transport system permease protein
MALESVSVGEVSSVKYKRKSRNLLTPMNPVFKQVLKMWQLYLLMILPIIYIVIFKYIPMYGAQIAFKEYVVTQGIWGSKWVGLYHFKRFFDSYQFWDIMRNTITLSLYQLIAGFPFPILLALSLNYVMNTKFKKLVQMVTYAPHFISTVVMVGIIFQILDPRIGLIGVFTKWIGMIPINWLGYPEFFQSIYVWSGIWQNVGFGCIIYLAALAAVDPALHEAAVMDGASKYRRIWHIDLPGIMPVVVILFILNVGTMLELGFEKAFLMQNPVNLQTSEIVDTYVYRVGIASQSVDFSYSSAIGLFKNVINLLLLLIVNRVARKIGQESLW